MNEIKKLKNPSDYANYSIRLTTDQKQIVDSTGKGLSAGIKSIIAFYKNWHNIDPNIRADLKLSCDEFSDLVVEYIKSKDKEEKALSAHYLELLRIHAIYIRRLYHHIDDPDGHFLQKQCFNDRGFYGYLEYFWKKEIPGT